MLEGTEFEKGEDIDGKDMGHGKRCQTEGDGKTEED